MKDKETRYENPKVLVIIPAHNEEDSIQQVIQEIDLKTIKCDILVVNDGSKDGTREKVKKTNAILLDLSNNLGIGGAVQTGYLYAKEKEYDIAIQVDGDGQHDTSYISTMIEEIQKGNDMVIGSRFVEDTGFSQTFFRMLGIKITSSIIKLIAHKKIWDTTSGFRAVTKDVIAIFANDYPYDYPEPISTMRLILKKKQIKEIPVIMRERTTGKSFATPIKSVAYMLKVTLSMLLMALKKD